MRKVFKNANNGDLDIIVENGTIVFLGKCEEEGEDLGGNDIFPGLVDIHSHGCIGHDVMDGEYLDEMSQFEAKNGVTSWIPTTTTVEWEEIKRVCSLPITKNPNAANVLGFHLEGPYINSKYKGAQNENFIKSPDIDEFNSCENVKMVTIAPELEGSMDFIKNCDAIVCIGHTAADYETVCEAADVGAKCLTHTFNAMPPLHHRNPGPIGAAIDKNLYVQVICDGIHIHKSVIKMLYKTFGSDRMILISDSMCATGVEDGEYVFINQPITVKNKIARTKEGALAGSTSTLFDCVKKAIEFGIPREEAFKMASTTPSELIGVKKGKLEVGYDADFIVVDKNNEIVFTVIAGEIIEK